MVAAYNSVEMCMRRYGSSNGQSVNGKHDVSANGTLHIQAPLPEEEMKEQILQHGAVPVWTRDQPHTLSGYYQLEGTEYSGKFMGDAKIYAINPAAPRDESGKYDFSQDRQIGNIAIRSNGAIITAYATEAGSQVPNNDQWEVRESLPPVKKNKAEFKERNADTNPVYNLSREILEKRQQVGKAALLQSFAQTLRTSLPPLRY